MDAPPIQYARTDDGVNIAYSVIGSGPPLVRCLGWLTHLELEWAWPTVRTFWERLAEHYTLIRYDGRGIGLSDRDIEAVTSEARISDLEAVVEEAGLGRFALFGISEGGPTAVSYAARHPDRVDRLVLYGTFADWGGGRPLSAEARGRQDALLTLVRQEWDGQTEAFRQVFTSLFLPDADRDSARRFNALQAASATSTVAASRLQGIYASDVREEATQITVPTLIVHRRDDQAVVLSKAQHLATLIPGARFVLLEGAEHHPLRSDGPSAAEMLDALIAFLGPGTRASDAPPRAVQTLLFTDVESSTALTQAVGDVKAQALLHGHNDAVRAALAAHGGREVKHTGDGIMAAFGSAVSAVEAALQIQRDLAGGEVRVRVGLNAGEPIHEDDDYFGTAVQLAARVCDRAEPGHVVVTQVVRDLVRGKGFQFEDLGAATLKGFPEPERLFAVRETG